MSVFMNQKHILASAKHIVEEMRRAPDGPAYEADDTYQACIDNLMNILSTGEANPDTTTTISNMVKDMENYKGLGILVDGRFSPISTSIAARFNIKAGSFVSGNRFLVITQDEYRGIMGYSNPSPMLDPDATWNLDTSSLVHQRYYYICHPEEILTLSKEVISRLGLDRAFVDDQFHFEDNQC